MIDIDRPSRSHLRCWKPFGLVQVDVIFKAFYWNKPWIIDYIDYMIVYNPYKMRQAVWNVEAHKKEVSSQMSVKPITDLWPALPELKGFFYRNFEADKAGWRGSYGLWSPCVCGENGIPPLNGMFGRPHFPIFMVAPHRKGRCLAGLECSL